MTVPKYIRRPRPDHRNRPRLHRTTFGLRQAQRRATMGLWLVYYLSGSA